MMKVVSTLSGRLSMAAIAVAQTASPQNTSQPHLETRNAYEAVVQFYFNSGGCQGPSQSFTLGNLNECHNTASSALFAQWVTVGSQMKQNVLYLRTIRDCGWNGDNTNQRWAFSELHIPNKCLFTSGGFATQSFFLESS